MMGRVFCHFFEYMMYAVACLCAGHMQLKQSAYASSLPLPPEHWIKVSCPYTTGDICLLICKNNKNFFVFNTSLGCVQFDIPQPWCLNGMSLYRMGGPKCGEAGGIGSERIHQMQNKGVRSLLNISQGRGSGGQDHRGETVCKKAVDGGSFLEGELRRCVHIWNLPFFGNWALLWVAHWLVGAYGYFEAGRLMHLSVCSQVITVALPAFHCSSLFT